MVQHFAKESDEAPFVVETVRAWLRTGSGREVCVVARTKDLIETRYLPLLQAAKVPAVVVDTDAEADLGDGVRLATMHRVKGLDEALPDDASREDHALQERRLLFVAATRARDELVVTGYGEKSPFVAG